MSLGLTRSTTSTIIKQATSRVVPPASSVPYHLAAIALLVMLAGLRLLYLCSQTQISLASDEAHYWDWSRHLDWCYYSKGPLVAWLIRASCWVWGADVMPAVRLPAVLCSSLTMLGVYLLVYRIFRDARIAFLALLSAQCLPFLHVGGLLMTIDAPYACAWTWAVYLSHVILFPPQRQTLLWWSLLGIVVAIGVLAKHNMALFVPSLGLFLLLCPEHRKELVRPGFWCMVLLGACLGGGPIVWWNAQHQWVTFLHVGTQATGQETTGLRWLGPFEFILTQSALLMGYLFVLMVMGFYQVIRSYCQRTILPQQLFLTCMALPMLLVCLVFSLKVRIEPNWPITAYITGLILAGWVLYDRWHITAWRRIAIVFMVMGLGLSLFIHRTEVLYPLQAKLFPQMSPRRWDPTCRLKGYSTLAQAVEELRKQQVQEPMLFGATWSYTGALAFHLPDQPTVYCLGPATGSRFSQYDFWQPNPLYQPELFVGRDAIIVGDIMPRIREAFEVMEPSNLVQAKFGNLVIAEWYVTIGRGLKPGGFGIVSQKY